MISKGFLSIILLLLSVFVVHSTAFAQLGTATINGTVLDSAGRVIGGAVVVVQNKDTGQTRELATGESGSYTITNLAPGVYKISFEAPNFALTTIENVVVRVGEVVTLRGVLRPKDVSEVVEIKANEIQGVDVTTSQVTGFIPSDTIQNLPLNGRNFLELAFLLPGNRPAVVFSNFKENVNQALVSSAGQSARGNNVSIDGADSNDDLSGGLLLNLPQDAVREFQIVTQQVSSDVGRTASSTINIVTKRGTNEFHGSAGVFFRNDALSALPAVLDRGVVKALDKPPFDREQYTFSFGGPIKRDRIWFFNALEFRNQDAILITGQRNLSQRQVITTFTPAPLNDLLFSSRIDAELNAKNRLILRYSLQDFDGVSPTFATSARPSVSSTFLQQPFTTPQAFTANLVHTFSPNLLNDFTFQVTKNKNNLNKSFNSPEISFPTFVDGASSFEPANIRVTRFQLRNNVSLIKGKHVVKFGGEYQRFDNLFNNQIFNPGAIFLTEDFASLDRNQDGQINDLDIPIDFTLQGINLVDNVEFDNNYFGLFFNDSWKANPRLTLNFGLRYEIDTNSTNRNGIKRVLATIPQLTPFVPPGSRKRDRDNISPSFGFNLDPFGDGRTSIHGGYGLYYNRIPSVLLDLESRIVPTAVRLGSEIDDDGNFLPGTPTLANPFIGELIPGDDGGLFVLDKALEHSMTHQFNFGIRREIRRDLFVSIDGVHTFTDKLPLRRFIGTVFNPFVGGDSAVINIEPSEKAWYDGMLISVEKRATGRFGFLASYTLSKTLDYSLDSIVGADVEDDNNLRGEKSASIEDERHRFTFSGIFNAPFGLTVSPIYRISSDIPFDIFLPDGSGRLPIIQRNAGARQFRTGAQLNAFIRQINAAGGVADIGLLPLVRDDLKFGDSFSSFDLRLAKNFKLSERINLQGIAEVFNLFNVTNIRGVDNGEPSGFQTTLLRDSEDPDDPGFLRSSSFGTKRATAGGVFGTGGPRAFQFAIRLNF